MPRTATHAHDTYIHIGLFVGSLVWLLAAVLGGIWGVAFGWIPAVIAGALWPGLLVAGVIAFIVWFW